MDALKAFYVHCTMIKENFVSSKLDAIISWLYLLGCIY